MKLIQSFLLKKKLLYSYLVLLLMLFGTALEAQTTTPEERAALLSIYNALDGPNWRVRHNNWGNGDPCTDNTIPGLKGWYGVQCNTAGNVITLGLGGNYLRGTMPPEIGDLIHLQHLYLTSNYINGPLPPEIGKLTQLVTLKIRRNNLGGPLPQDLGNLVNLEELELHENAITGPIPSSIGNLSKLKVLWLYNNKLSGNIPPEIGDLQNLERLFLSYNQLDGNIPSSLGRLLKLQYLDLTYNNLDGVIPADLGLLQSIIQLQAEHNKLSGNIPKELGNLPNLNRLALSNNQLSGTIPKELSGLTSLSRLLLGGNQLIGSIPPEIGQLSNLTALSLYGNNLSGPIPPEIGQLRALTTIELSINNIDGPIPPEIGQLVNLSSLRMFDNQLIGPIPTEIGNLVNLQSIKLENNNIDGEIPASIGNLPFLREIYLYNNNISGSIPPEIGNLNRLQTLSIFNNNLSGSIPPEIGNMPALRGINARYNKLTGSLPPELALLPSISFLDFRNNMLSGCFDPALKALCGIPNMRLDGNPGLPSFSAFCSDGTGECLSCVIQEITPGPQTPCASLNNTYTQELTISYVDPPADGYLMVNGQQFPITGSPQTITLTGLIADGAPFDITAYFSSEDECSFSGSALFTAPSACFPPVAKCQDITIAAGNDCTASANIDNASFDPDDDALIITQDPPGPYILGETLVTLTVSDGSSSDQCSATVNVVDNSDPIPDLISLPDIRGECSAFVEVPPTATDNCSGTLVGTTTDPLYYDLQGTFTVTWKFDDGHDNVIFQDQQVIVKDVTTPDITLKQLAPKILDKSNHRYSSFSVPDFIAFVSDNCTELDINDVVIIRVESDEGEDGDEGPIMNDGRTSDDMIISDDCFSVQLRNELNLKGNGRVYTIYFSVDDGNGNITIIASEVHVIADGEAAIKDEVLYTVVNKFCGLQTEFQAKFEPQSNVSTSYGTTFLNNYPNPFNNTTVIEYQLSEDGHVLIEIFDINGQKVSTVVDDFGYTGFYSKEFDALNLSNGIYVCRLIQNGKSVVKKMIVRQY